MIKRAIPSILVFLSGFAGLVYQVLWMRQLGLLFGNTSHAAAATLAAFFAGLASGSWFWGERATRSRNPLQTYAWLETGIAVTAVLYFVILVVFYRVYPLVHRGMAPGAGLLAVKFLLALLLVFPPAFCMGGTIPVLAQFVIRRKTAFGTTAALLYGVNVLGAALGAFMAGFVFVSAIGARATCGGAIAVTGIVAATAFYLSRTGYSPGPSAAEDPPEEDAGPVPIRARAALRGICFLSGFGVLALEVLWTRMFAQIHENSVYSFTLVLVLVLTCLALGSLLASRLALLKFHPVRTLAALTMAGGIAVSLSPFVFMRLTRRFEMISTGSSLAGYMGELFTKGALVIGIPALLLGTVFPFMMKAEERFADQPGRCLGRLSAVNTLGAILGSVLCGFVMLEHLGMWRTMQMIAALYLAAATVLPLLVRTRAHLTVVVGAASLMLLFTALSPARLPAIGRDPARPVETVVEVWETSDCTVSVTMNRVGHRAIQINSNYRLGSTEAFMGQVSQATIPLFVFPATRSIFFLGLGTGITAGAALGEPFGHVERVVACELVPEVVTAARKYVAGEQGGVGAVDFTGGLFSDKRAEILVEDGRHYLMATDDTFDMINADLFLPYRSGAGSLYSLKHFESSRRRLNPGGVFVQWLPLFQLTELEFGVIARTMLSVFDRVTLWRSNFQPGGEIVALFGHADAAPLPPTAVDMGAETRASLAALRHTEMEFSPLQINEQTVLLFYCGNLTACPDFFEQYPVNTDDRPVIEYSVPRTLRQPLRDMPHTLVGPNLTSLVDRIQARCPPESDPLLADRKAADRRLPRAGAAFHRAWLARAMGNSDEWQRSWETFVQQIKGD